MFSVRNDPTDHPLCISFLCFRTIHVVDLSSCRVLNCTFEAMVPRCSNPITPRITQNSACNGYKPE